MVADNRQGLHILDAWQIKYENVKWSDPNSTLPVTRLCDKNMGKQIYEKVFTGHFNNGKK